MPQHKAKDAYRDYYEQQKTAIGGDDRFVWLSQDLLKDLTGKSVLDVGCGEGSLLKLLRDKGNAVFGIDASETGRVACREKGIECHVVDISNERYPYPDNAFDVVLCLETLEHVENPHNAVGEIKRVLKEGGTCVISIPNPRSLHGYIYPGLFEFSNFREFLRLNGFEIAAERGWGQTGLWNRARRWLRSLKSPLADAVDRSIFYLNRKRNSLFRNHVGTPTGCCACLNYVCTNHKQRRSLLEEVADETIPGGVPHNWTA